MGKKDGEKIEITGYRMSIHFGVCHGPVDYVGRIFIGEKEAFATGQALYSGVYGISNLELFGGLKKEGGVHGAAYILFGEETQLMPADICVKYGIPQDEMPAYRGLLTVFFTEFVTSTPPGFLWSINNPYLKSVWIELGRHSVGLPEATSRIYRQISNYQYRDLTGDAALSRDKMDVFASTLAYITATGHIKITSLAGAVVADITPAYTAQTLMICTAKAQLLVLDDEGNFYVYSLTGTLLDTITAGAPPTGFVANTWTGMQEITVDGETWVFYWGDLANAFGSCVCTAFSNDGSGWNYRFESFVGTFFITANGFAVGPNYLYVLMQSGGAERYDWDSSGISNRTSINPTGFTGPVVNALSYDAASNHVILQGTDDMFVLSEDCSTIISQLIGGEWSNQLVKDTFRSRRYSFTTGTFTFMSQVVSGTEHFNFYVYEIATMGQLNVYPLSAWGVDQNLYDGAYYGGFSTTEQAWAVVSDSHAGIHWLPSHGVFDSNPAHMIYEIMRNKSWGGGFSAGAIDYDAFVLAGETLYAENFGLSIIWVRQTTVEAFVKEVLDHIEAALFIDPETGLLTIKLIRNDYDIDDLPEFDETNSTISKFKRKLYGETVNEIVVTWTDPATEEEDTVRAQNDANVAIQGDLVSDGRNYYGVRVKALATSLAYRDLRVASSPLATCDIEMDRSAWNLKPAQVIKITSAEDGVESLIMRVGPIDYGNANSPTIKASLTEDVWGQAKAEYEDAPASEWVDPSEEPEPADPVYILTLPYFLMLKLVTPAALAGAADPTVFAGVLAATEQTDTAGFTLWGEKPDIHGVLQPASLGDKSFTSHAELNVALDQETTSLIESFDNRTFGHGPEAGGLIVIGDGDETEVEIVSVLDYEVGVGYTVQRGVMDTTPKGYWPIGTPVWFITVNSRIADNTPRSDGETVEYEILTRTSLGILALADAPVETATLTERPWLPTRPADVQVEGVAFQAPGDIYDASSNGFSYVVVTYADRNRLEEDSVLLAWDAAPVTPEVGQTTTVSVLDPLDRSVITTNDGVTSSPYHLAKADFGGLPYGIVRVTSKRDGVESLQGHELTIRVSAITADTTVITADTTFYTGDEG